MSSIAICRRQGTWDILKAGVRVGSVWKTVGSGPVSFSVGLDGVYFRGDCANTAGGTTRRQVPHLREVVPMVERVFRELELSREREAALEAERKIAADLARAAARRRVQVLPRNRG